MRPPGLGGKFRHFAGRLFEPPLGIFQAFFERGFIACLGERGGRHDTQCRRRRDCQNHPVHRDLQVVKVGW
jgi:hypothetical protein